MIYIRLCYLRGKNKMNDTQIYWLLVTQLVLPVYACIVVGYGLLVLGVHGIILVLKRANGATAPDFEKGTSL
jgi:hypothetical protein